MFGKQTIGYSMFEGVDVGQQDGQMNGVRLTSGPFGTFWGPHLLAHPKIVNLAQLLHGQKLWTDKPTKPQTHKQTNIHSHNTSENNITPLLRRG